MPYRAALQQLAMMRSLQQNSVLPGLDGMDAFGMQGVTPGGLGSANMLPLMAPKLPGLNPVERMLLAQQTQMPQQTSTSEDVPNLSKLSKLLESVNQQQLQLQEQVKQAQMIQEQLAKANKLQTQSNMFTPYGFPASMPSYPDVSKDFALPRILPSQDMSQLAQLQQMSQFRQQQQLLQQQQQFLEKSRAMSESILGNKRALERDEDDSSKTKKRLTTAQELDFIVPGSLPKRRKVKKVGNSTSKYRGVSWHKRDRRWMARVWISGKIRSLGNHVSEKKAALAVDLKLLEVYGSDADLQLNFPDPEERKRVAEASDEEEAPPEDVSEDSE